MATIVAGVMCSHAPTIMVAQDSGLRDAPEWRPLFSGISALTQWLADQHPDHLVVVTNDHMTQFDLSCWPTFAIGIVDQYPIGDEGRGRRPLRPIPSDSTFSTILAELLVSRGIDLAISRNYEADHGVHSALWLLDPDWRWPVTVVHLNTILPPLPSPGRFWEFGEILGRAIGEVPDPRRVAVIALGGLSHELSGPEFGRVNAEWDRYCMDALARSPGELLCYRAEEVQRRGGAEGLELYHWLAARSAVGEQARAVVQFYCPRGITGLAGMGFEL